MSDFYLVNQALIDSPTFLRLFFSWMTFTQKMEEGKIRNAKLSWPLGMGTLQNAVHQHCYFLVRELQCWLLNIAAMSTYAAQ